MEYTAYAVEGPFQGVYLLDNCATTLTRSWLGF